MTDIVNLSATNVSCQCSDLLSEQPNSEPHAATSSTSQGVPFNGNTIQDVTPSHGKAAIQDAINNNNVCEEVSTNNRNVASQVSDRTVNTNPLMRKQRSWNKQPATTNTKSSSEASVNILQNGTESASAGSNESQDEMNLEYENIYNQDKLLPDDSEQANINQESDLLALSEDSSFLYRCLNSNSAEPAVKSELKIELDQKSAYLLKNFIVQGIPQTLMRTLAEHTQELVVKNEEIEAAAENIKKLEETVLNLTASQEEAEKKVQEVSAKLTSLQATHATLQKTLNNKDEELAASNSNIIQLESQKTGFETKLKTLIDENQKIQVEANSATQQLEKFTAKLSTANDEQKSLNEKLQAAQRDNSTQGNTIADLHNQISTNNEKITNLTTEKDQAKKTLEKVSSEKKEITEKMDTLTQELEQTEINLNNSLAAKEKLESDIDDLNKKIKGLTSDQETLKQSVQSSEAQLEAANKELETAKAKHVALETAHANLTKDNQTLNNQITTSKKALEEADSKIQQLTIASHKTTTQITQLKEQLKEKEEQLAKLNNVSKDNTEVIAAVTEEKTQLNEQISNLEMKLASLNKEKSQQEVAIQDLTTEKENLKKNNNDLLKKVKELSKEKKIFEQQINELNDLYKNSSENNSKNIKILEDNLQKISEEYESLTNTSALKEENFNKQIADLRAKLVAAKSKSANLLSGKTSSSPQPSEEIPGAVHVSQANHLEALRQDQKDAISDRGGSLYYAYKAYLKGEPPTDETMDQFALDYTTGLSKFTSIMHDSSVFQAKPLNPLNVGIYTSNHPNAPALNVSLIALKNIFSSLSEDEQESTLKSIRQSFFARYPTLQLNPDPTSPATPIDSPLAAFLQNKFDARGEKAANALHQEVKELCQGRIPWVVDFAQNIDDLDNSKAVKLITPIDALDALCHAINIPPNDIVTNTGKDNTLNLEVRSGTNRVKVNTATIVDTSNNKPNNAAWDYLKKERELSSNICDLSKLNATPRLSGFITMTQKIDSDNKSKLYITHNNETVEVEFGGDRTLKLKGDMPKGLEGIDVNNLINLPSTFQTYTPKNVLPGR